MNDSELIDLLNSARFDEARLVLYERVKQNRDDRFSWMKLAAIALRDQTFEEGVEPFAHLVRLSPRDTLASSGLASCLFESGEYLRAKQEIERFKILFPCEGNIQEPVRHLLREHDGLLERIASKER